MAVVPYTFADQSGQIPLAELDVNFANVKAFAVTAGNVTGNIQSNITALGTLTSLTVSGNVTAPNFVGNLIGNISGNILVPGANTQVLFNDNNAANASSGMTFNKNNNDLTVAGNIIGTGARLTIGGNATIGINASIGANATVGGFLLALGRVTGDSLTATSGNIGVPPGQTTMRLGNVNPTTIWIGGDATNVYIANVNSTTQVAGNLVVGAAVSATGSINTSANIVGANVLTSGTISAAGNITGGNIIGTIIGTVSTPSVSASGNITGGNLLTNGVVSATGNITGGNLLTGGAISAAGNIIGGNFIDNDLVSGRVIFAGTSKQLTDSNNFAWDNANSVLTVTGTSSVTGNVTSGNLLTGGTISAAGNVTGGNLSITGTSTLTGVATAPTAANGVSNTQVATTAFVANSMLNLLPSGVIVMWSGSLASIPTGWLLCNGTGGTPDLRNRFVVGAGSTYLPNNTGGSADAVVVQHTHTATSAVFDPGHAHSYTAPASTGSDATGFDTEIATTTPATTGTNSTGITVATTITSTGVSGTNANLPPYYALAYIMKA